MDILISGGAGFIGSQLALKLIALGHHVTVLDSLSSQVHGSDAETDSYLFGQIRDHVTFVQGDVTSRTDWEQCLQGKDAVVHLAAETGTGQSMYQIARYTETNVGGTALLLDVLTNWSERTVKKVVLASSRAVYGEGKYLTADGRAVYPLSRSKLQLDRGEFEVSLDGVSGPLTRVATDEAAKLHPTSVYGLTKLQQEQLITMVCETIGIKPVILRYQNVYGPGQSLLNPYTGILSIFSTLIRRGREINIFEDGQESRDFVYIDDVVDATILALTKPSTDNHHILNVGSGVATSVQVVAETLMKYFDREVPLNISGNYRLGDIRHNVADITRAAKLGFAPKVTFEQGIKRFVEWVEGQQDRENGFEQSLNEMAERGLFK